MLNLFLIKIFGFYTGYRLLKYFCDKSIVTDVQMTKIGIAFVFVNGLTSIITSQLVFHWLSVFIPVFTLIVFVFVRYIYMERQFCSEFPEFLTKIILKMKTGWSFRKSFERCCEEAPEAYRERLYGIFQNVVFSQQIFDKKMTLKMNFYTEIVQIFKKVDQSSHRSIERLENFRGRLIIIKSFRRKSGVIRGQITMQCYLLLFIYISCFAVVGSYFSLRGSSKILFLSLTLFITGFFLIYFIGRRVKWKI